MNSKNLFLFFLLAFSFSCKDNKKENLKDKKTSKCDVQIKINSENLCIPFIGSLINGNNNETVKKALSLFENEDSKTFVFYIDEKSYSEISKSTNDYRDKNLVTNALNEYYFLYQTNNLINIKSSDQVKQKLNDYFLNNYDVYKKQDGENYNIAFKNIEFDKSYLIESFKNIKIGGAISYVIIFKTNINDKELKLINILTPIELNDKIYFVSYNKKYQGILSDFEAKERAGYINEQLYESN